MIAGEGDKVIASAPPPAVPHHTKASACAWPSDRLSVEAVPTFIAVNLCVASGISPVTTLWPSTAMDCVSAVAIWLLFVSTSVDEITVPLTKFGYGLLYVPEPFLAIV